ncbi:TRAP-type mannitol/chloroaromatic compound transport system, small permease component [Desulfacinum infernum DSM 9756]|uniref:TRAP-type mannitol/chloroaromatic compound transport system, small permease component n=2 Tax=Desulfacinum infernum TaxID=35837 RepID=A0A1M5IBG7_9BACT|nr:TRAP-type mannitol/chloroaromatic compound transport system, small permease component [Desulfacinum infernum DSM 9756]
MSHASTTTMRGPAPAARRLVEILDGISVAMGKASSVLVLPMMCILVYEVVSRYFFNAPTIWAGDLALILYGIYFMVASPFCLKDGMHIRTDFLYNRWSTKTKGLVDTIIYVFLYLPTHVVFLEIGWKYFYKSFKQNESIVSSPWMPIIWPMKFAIPLSVFLMILQGLSETIKSYYAWRHGVFYWENNPHGGRSEEGDACEAQA